MGHHVAAGQRPPARSSLRERAAVIGWLAFHLGLATMIWCTGSPLFGPAIGVTMAGALALLVSSRLDRDYLNWSRVVRVVRAVPIPLWLSAGLYFAAPAPWIAGLLYLRHQRG